MHWKLFLISILTYICNSFSTLCKDGSVCPGKETCCLTLTRVACCPYENAICCGDGQHCCPSGFSCGENYCTSVSRNKLALPYLFNKNNAGVFLDTSNEEANTEDSKVSKTELNFSSNRNVDREINSNEKLHILEEEKIQNYNIMDSTSETYSSVRKSRYQTIMEKLNYLNESYFKRLMVCFKDMKPVVQDFMDAYKERKENRAATLIKMVSELLSRLSIDGGKLSSDCKGLLTLAGIIGMTN